MDSTEGLCGVESTKKCGGVKAEVRTDMDSAEGNVGILQVQPKIDSLGAIIPPARAGPPAADVTLLTSGNLLHKTLVSTPFLKITACNFHAAPGWTRLHEVRDFMNRHGALLLPAHNPLVMIFAMHACMHACTQKVGLRVYTCPVLHCRLPPRDAKDRIT